MRIQRVVSSLIKDRFRVIKTTSSGNPYNSRQILPFGFDSVPLKNMFAITITIFGKQYIIGHVNKAVENLESGESIVYSKDNEGNISSKVIAKNNGDLILNDEGDYAMRYNEMLIAFNQLRGDLNDLVELYNEHVHPGVLVGTSSSAITESLAYSSTADMSKSKIDEIKVPPSTVV